MSNKYVKTIDIEKNLKDKLVSALEKKNISIKIKESVNEGADYSKVPTKKLVKTYKQMADERLSSSAALTFRLIAKELIKRKAKLEGTCGYAPEGKVDVHNTDKLTPAGPHLLKKQKKKVESTNEKVIKNLNEDEAGDVLNDYIYYQLANTIKDTQKKWGKVQDWGDKNPKKAQVIIKMVVALDKKIKQISR